MHYCQRATVSALCLHRVMQMMDETLDVDDRVSISTFNVYQTQLCQLCKVRKVRVPYSTWMCSMTQYFQPFHVLVADYGFVARLVACQH
jgi:hypothetical protein